MRRSFRLRPTTRRRLAWLAAFLLLWQQVGMAAYACTMAPAALATMAMHADGQSMHEACPSMVDRHTNGHALCQTHCRPDQATQPDGRAGSVPPSLLAALPTSWPPLARAAVPSRAAPAWLHRLRAPPTPASLLFCSLLI